MALTMPLSGFNKATCGLWGPARPFKRRMSLLKGLKGALSATEVRGHDAPAMKTKEDRARPGNGQGRDDTRHHLRLALSPLSELAGGPDVTDLLQNE